MDTSTILGSFSTADEITFDRENHMYRVSGIPIPSVTQLMQPLTQTKYSTVNDLVLQMAADRGTEVHTAIEFFLKYGIAEISERGRAYLDAFMAWYNDYNPQIISSERMTYHRTMLYAGTVDLLASVAGKQTLIDYKTTAVIHDSLTTVQLEAYQRALASEGVQVDQKAILQLKQDGTYSFKVYQANDMEAWKTFCALVTIQAHNIKYGG